MECSICLQTFSDPRLLPCGHTFFFECLRKVARGKRSVECPQDRRSYRLPDCGVACLPCNFAIRDVIDRIPPPSAPRGSLTSTKVVLWHGDNPIPTIGDPYFILLCLGGLPFLLAAIMFPKAAWSFLVIHFFGANIWSFRLDHVLWGLGILCCAWSLSYYLEFWILLVVFVVRLLSTCSSALFT
mmetsp:Transcript_45497/g.74133  ORF Transcript_45497/g.74133 Transcript_45497/m.74133 type:complete len:184 (+) Transcript_45497:392-943(+)